MSINEYSQTHIKRTPLGQIKWSSKTGDLLKEVQFIWNFLWQQEKGDLLIQMTAYRGDHMGRFNCIS
jgi:hypothetical protein